MEARLAIRTGIYFLVLLFLQILLFNYVSIGVGMIPFVYILGLILLPIEVPNWFLLVYSFILGISVDVAGDTMALNTSALMFSAFIRPRLIRFLAPDDGYKAGTLPSFFSFKAKRFLLYITIIIFVHQLVFFTLDIFKLSKILIIIFKAFFNTFYSLVFILIIHLLFLKNK